MTAATVTAASSARAERAEKRVSREAAVEPVRR